MNIKDIPDTLEELIEWSLVSPNLGDNQRYLTLSVPQGLRKGVHGSSHLEPCCCSIYHRRIAPLSTHSIRHKVIRREDRHLPPGRACPSSYDVTSSHFNLS